MRARPCLWCVAVLALSCSAAAQEPEPPSRQVGGAVEWSTVVDGWGGAAAVRLWRGRLGVDLGAAAWRSETRFDFPKGGGPAITDFRSRTAFSAGASVLARAQAGRFAFIAGAGPALFSTRTSTRTLFDGVDASKTQSTSGTLGLRFLLEGEADVRRRLSAFLGARAELIDLRHGVCTGALSAGLRLRF